MLAEEYQKTAKNIPLPDMYFLLKYTLLNCFLYSA